MTFVGYVILGRFLGLVFILTGLASAGYWVRNDQNPAWWEQCGFSLALALYGAYLYSVSR